MARCTFLEPQWTILSHGICQKNQFVGKRGGKNLTNVKLVAKLTQVFLSWNDGKWQEVVKYCFLRCSSRHWKNTVMLIAIYRHIRRRGNSKAIYLSVIKSTFRNQKKATNISAIGDSRLSSRTNNCFVRRDVMTIQMKIFERNKKKANIQLCVQRDIFVEKAFFVKGLS